jgi:dGTPase
LWAALLSNQRLYGQSFPQGEYDRSEFQRDYDRIIFSSAFRRLQDKTQVFPLSMSDYTRNRLTHSLEVSSAGRTLGTLAGNHLKTVGVTCVPHEIGTIVATAALAHDIGNPPFGHSGEAAIQSWAKHHLLPPLDGKRRAEGVITMRTRRCNALSVLMTPEELADFHNFGSNAQGLRILVRTGIRRRKGGMRPTLATLGAVAKYPRPSLLPNEEKPTSISQKKCGYFQDDRAMVSKAFRTLGLIEMTQGCFSRHPLAFLTEAADDACYAIADIEDAYKLGILNFNDTCEVLFPLATRDKRYSEPAYLRDNASRIGRMRAFALGVLVRECSEVFRSSFDEIENGKLEVPLLRRTRVTQEYDQIIALAKERVYTHDRVLEIEYAGYSAIGGLLDMFYAALCDPKDEPKDTKLRRLLPVDLVYRRGQSDPLQHSKYPFDFYLNLMTPYERLLAVTDYVSGMTDGYAVRLYQRLSGIRLPD